MVKTILSTTQSDSNAGTTTAGATQYWFLGYAPSEPNSTESTREITHRTAGTLSKLYVRVTANTTSTNSTVTIRKNAGDTTLTTTITAGTPGVYEDTANSVTIAAGDKLCIKTVSGGTGTFTFSIISTIFDATTDCSTRLVSKGYGVATASVTHFISVAGDRSGTTATEAASENTIKTAGTAKNAFINVTANARTTNTTFTLRKNRANTAITFTYTSGETGIKEDTSNSISYAVDDEIDWAIVTSTGTQTLTFQCAAIDYVTTTNNGVLTTGVVGTTSDIVMGEPLTWFFPIGGGMRQALTTEADTQMKAREAFTFKNLIVYVGANTINATSTFRLRVNGADAISQNITTTQTGFIANTTDTVTVAEGDLINFAITTPAVSGSQTMTIRQMSITTELAALTRVENDLIVKYNIVARVTNDFIAKYNITGRVTNDLVAKYNIVQRITNDLITKYNIVQRVTNDLIAKYNIMGRVTNDLIAKYNILERIVNSLIVKYTIFQRVWLGALSFNPTNLSYVDMTNTTNLKIGQTAGSECSYSFWIKVNGNPSATAVIVSRGDAMVPYVSTIGILRCDFRYPTLAAVFPSSSTNVVNNQWRHVVVSHSDITDSSKIYVDGLIKSTTTGKDEPLKDTTTTRFLVGAQHSAGNQINYFNGLIDDVRVYNKQLTDGEVTDLSNKVETVASGNLVSRWTFNERVGTVAYDRVGGNNGTLSAGGGGSVPVWVDDDPLGMTIKYNIYQRITNDLIAKYNILGRVVNSLIVKYNIIQRVTNDLILKYNIFQRVVNNLIVKYNITGRITNDLIVKYDIIGRVVQDLIVKYNITGRVTNDLIAKYSITGRTTNDLIVKYNIIQRVTADLILKYNILNRVVNDLIVKYDIQGIVLTRVENDLIVKYNIIGRIANDLIVKYNIRQRIVNDLIAKYNIDQRVTNDLVIKYNIIQRVVNSLIVKYNIIQRVTNDLIVKYDIISLVLERVVADLVVKYNIHRRVTNDLIVKYAIKIVEAPLSLIRGNRWRSIVRRTNDTKTEAINEDEYENKAIQYLKNKNSWVRKLF